MLHIPAPRRDIVRTVLVHARPRRSPDLPCRVMDVVVAAAALILLAPTLVGVTLLVLFDGTGPVIFRHRRIGRGGVPFEIFKFRTMRADGDAVLAAHLKSDPRAADEWAQFQKLKSDPRVSRLGRILRKSSLDELPQLFNVLRGEMSIVGPRPIVQSEVVRYGRMFACYCSVKPGITGIWQVSGRNDVSYRRRVAMDAIYSRRKGVLLDLSLMLATFPAVLLRRGSY